VHDGHEQVGDLSQILVVSAETVEQVSQRLQVEVVVVGLNAIALDFLLELTEGTSVSGLVLLEELEHLLDALGRELLANVVQVVRFPLPEVELGCRIRMLTVLKVLLWVFLKNILDLLGPVGDSLFQEGAFVLGRRLLGAGDVVWRQWKLGASHDVSNGNVGVSQEDVELVHEILGNELRHVHHVQGVAENGKVDIVTDEVEIRKNVSGELHEDDLFIDVVIVDVEFFTFGAGPDSEDKKSLLLDHVGGWWCVEELDFVWFVVESKQEHLVPRGV